jgi:hypothetical protein
MYVSCSRAKHRVFVTKWTHFIFGEWHF